MAKVVRDARLGSKEARAKLKPRPKPYYRDLGGGLHLGLRKGARRGVWVARRYLGDGKYEVESLGEAEDAADADGQIILSFEQAQEKARAHVALAVEKARIIADGPTITVGSAVERYLSTRKTGVKARGNAVSRLTKHVYSDPALCEKPLLSLVAGDLAAWRAKLAASIGETTVRRIVNDFKAALNAELEVNRQRLPAALAMEIKIGLRPVEILAPIARENQVLGDEDIRRIVSAAKEIDDEEGWRGGLFRMIAVLAATGARFSQIARMKVADVQVKNERLMIPTSNKGRGQKQKTHVAVRVGPDVIEALRPALKGRGGPDYLFTRPRWRQERVGVWVEVDPAVSWGAASELSKPWQRILAKAGLPENIVPYALRHSSVVRGLRAGLPVLLVADLHDTSAEMIEQHYGAYIVDAMNDLAASAIVPLMPVEPRPIRAIK